MLKHSDLPPKLETFTFREDATGLTQMWAVGLIIEDIQAGKLKPQLVRIPIEEETTLTFYENKSIDQHRLDYIVNNPDCITRPLIGVPRGDGTPRLIDGRHRYVVAAWHSLHTGKQIELPGYILTAEQAEQYEVELPPEASTHEAIQRLVSQPYVR